MDNDVLYNERNEIDYEGFLMRYLKTNKMYCFSPPVMIVTFVIEVGCALYAALRYKMTTITRLAVVLLLCLALFQFAEFNVCEGTFNLGSLVWARIGCVAITLLPPLGLHMTTLIANKKYPLLVTLGYVSSLIFLYTFITAGGGIESQQCLGNYVIFNIAKWANVPYLFYYYGWLLVTVGLAWKWGREMKVYSKRISLYALAVGYLAFVVPTTAANIINPTTVAGIPSIMCGFAVILALMMIGFVLPRYYMDEEK